MTPYAIAAISTILIGSPIALLLVIRDCKKETEFSLIAIATGLLVLVVLSMVEGFVFLWINIK